VGSPVSSIGATCAEHRARSIFPSTGSLSDTESRAAFRAAYGPLTKDTLARARVLALFFDATLVVYANDKGRDDLQTEALQGLNRTLID
jgi:hypothetical protein